MLGLTPSILIARIIVLVVAFTVHEFAHAWTAVYLGDDTPRLQGRLTLNPLSHLDPMGSLLLIFAGFGWARPVPVNPYVLSRRHRYGMLIVAAAGPLSNVVMAVLAALPFTFGLLSLGPTGAILPTMSQLLGEFMFINLLLAIFNLIPLYPLDGEKIAFDLFPPNLQDSLMRIRPYSTLILIGVLFIGPMLGFNLFGFIFQPVLNAFRFIFGI